MPIRLKRTGNTAPEDDIALWRRLLAGGLRVGSGVLSSSGLGIGAMVAGAGEWAAQAAEEAGTDEGFTPNKKRIFAEMAIGAVPFGKVVKGVANGGKIAFDAAKSAALTASGEALRQGYASDDAGYLPDADNIGWGSVGLAGLLGLGGGAIGSKWAASRKPKTPLREDVVEHTAQPGGRVLGPGGKLEGVSQPVIIRSGTQAPPTPRPRLSTEVPYRMTGDVDPRQGTLPFNATEDSVTLVPKAAVPYGMGSSEFPTPYRSAAKAAQKAEDAGIDSEALLREQDAAARRAQIAGLDFGGTTPVAVAKTASKWTPEVIEQLARQIPEAATSAAPVADDAAGTLLRFFKSPLEAAGEGYGAIKAAKAAGEVVPEEGRRIAGQVAQRLRKEAGVPPTPRPAPKYPEPTTTGPWVDEQLRYLAEMDKAKAAGRPFTTSMNLAGLSSDLARIIQEDPEFATQLFAGAAGAGIGAATSDDPLAGAVVGGLGGFVAPKAIPALLRAIGTPVDALRNIEINLQTPEGIKDAAQKVFTSLPQVQRFNYLAGINLIPNSVAGPWGAAFMGALEHGLAGDPRGWAALRELRNIPKFIKDTAITNTEEARQLLHAGHLGRAESGLLDYGPEKLREAIGYPGMMMTSGDLSARKILLAAGFSEDEARRITLTSEPVGETFRTLAEAGKNSVPIQMLMPFRRTPANIAQQGLQRNPLTGWAMDQQGTPLNQQLISQLFLTPVVAGTNYAIGANVDPETAKWLRPWMNNLGGQYSLSGGIGFAAGQAYKRGQSVPRAVGKAAIRDAFPIPTTDSAENLYNWLFTKQTPTPSPFTDLEGFIREAPRGTVPSIAKSFVEETARTGIPSPRRRIRLRSQ